MKGPVGQRIFGWSRQNSASAPGSHQRWHRWSIDQASGQAKHQVEIYCKFKFLYIYNIYIYFYFSHGCHNPVIKLLNPTQEWTLHIGKSSDEPQSGELDSSSQNIDVPCALEVLHSQQRRCQQKGSDELPQQPPSTFGLALRIQLASCAGSCGSKNSRECGLQWLIWHVQSWRKRRVDMFQSFLRHQVMWIDAEWPKVKSWVIWVCWMCVVSRCHPAQNWPSQAFPYA